MKTVLFCLGFLLSLPSLGQDLPIIAVTEIRASIDSRAWTDYKNSKAMNFQNMLETQLVKVGRFKIIERERIGDILSEQLLQGEFSGVGTSLAVGAVDYVVFGSVTRFGSKERVISTERFASSRLVTEFGLDLKVVSARDGEIRRAESVDVSIESGSATNTRGFSTSEGTADPLADVQRRAAKKVAAAIAESIFPIEIVAFREDAEPGCCAYVNYGEAVLSVGDRLKIVQLGEALIDETTGLNLGAVEQTVGVVEVVEVLDRFSKARVISGAMPQKGQIARIASDSAGPSSQGGAGPSSQRARLGREI